MEKKRDLSNRDWERVWEKEEIKEADNKEPAFLIVNKISENYPKGAKILDAGSGLGKWVFYWQKKGYQGFGLDFVERAISRAKDYAKKEKIDCIFKK